MDDQQLGHVDCFTSLDDIKGNDRSNLAIVLAVIIKKGGRFSAFDAYDQRMASTLTRIMESDLVRRKPDVGYPWTVIELTDAGKAYIGSS